MNNNKPAYPFTNDIEKLLDMLILNKEEFLKSYSYLTPEEYDNTVTRVGPIGSYKFVSNILDVMRRQKSELVLRLAFNHLFDIGANSLKDVSYDYIRESIVGNALMTDAFAQDIVVYAKHLSRLPFIEMAVWFSRNIEYDVGDDKPSYQRLDEIAYNAINLSVADPVINEMPSETLRHLRYDIDLTDEEIEHFGYGYVLDCDVDNEDESYDER